MILIPERLVSSCNRSSERRQWLERLPHVVQQLQRRWELTLAPPFDGDEVSCAWVAPAVLRNGSRAVLKLGMPQMEGAHELQGLRFWDGDPTIRLLNADVELNAMLLESCDPGIALRSLPEREQDVVIAQLLLRLWRIPPAPHPFRPLAAMTAHWAAETRAEASRWPDAALIEEGLRLLEELACPSPNDVLLATDLHAGNVLSARRAPWLVIDPKPFIGDRAYDVTQHLLNCKARVLADPHGVIDRLANLVAIDPARVRLWLLARSAAEPRDSWDDESLALARALA